MADRSVIRLAGFAAACGMTSYPSRLRLSLACFVSTSSTPTGSCKRDTRREARIALADATARAEICRRKTLHPARQAALREIMSARVLSDIALGVRRFVPTLFPLVFFVRWTAAVLPSGGYLAVSWPRAVGRKSWSVCPVRHSSKPHPAWRGSPRLPWAITEAVSGRVVLTDHCVEESKVPISSMASWCFRRFYLVREVRVLDRLRSACVDLTQL